MKAEGEMNRERDIEVGIGNDNSVGGGQEQQGGNSHLSTHRNCTGAIAGLQTREAFTQPLGAGLSP